MRSFIVFVLSILLSGVSASETEDQSECHAIKEKIRHIQSRMRAGYSRAQGERMEAQLRKLRKQRKAKC